MHSPFSRVSSIGFLCVENRAALRGLVAGAGLIATLAQLACQFDTYEHIWGDAALLIHSILSDFESPERDMELMAAKENLVRLWTRCLQSTHSILHYCGLYGLDKLLASEPAASFPSELVAALECVSTRDPGLAELLKGIRERHDSLCTR